MKQLVWIMLVAAWTSGGGAAELPAVIDWSAWDAILRAHVVDGSVNYDAIAREPGFRATVEAIAAARLDDQPREARLAFLINAYNVLAVEGILDGSSPRTALGKLSFFYRDRYTVAGKRLSLSALERDWLRPLGEPRIHFAIVCASVSCPPLRSEAYLPDRLDGQLDDNTRRFLADRDNIRFDLDRGIAEISRIFKWFHEDFEVAGGVQPFMARFVDSDEVAAALRAARLELRYLGYDWSLNGSFRGSGG